MRIDQLFGPNGFDPDHPSGNVLDEFVHGECCGTDDSDPLICTCIHSDVTVRHYDGKGEVVDERTLTPEEHDAFFVGGLTPEDRIAVNDLGNASLMERMRYESA